MTAVDGVSAAGAATTTDQGKAHTTARHSDITKDEPGVPPKAELIRSWGGIPSSST